MFRRRLACAALICALSIPALASNRDDSDHQFLPRIIRFIQSHLPPWLHAAPADDYINPPRP